MNDCRKTIFGCCCCYCYFFAEIFKRFNIKQFFLPFSCVIFFFCFVLMAVLFGTLRGIYYMYCVAHSIDHKSFAVGTHTIFFSFLFNNLLYFIEFGTEMIERRKKKRKTRWKWDRLHWNLFINMSSASLFLKQSPAGCARYIDTPTHNTTTKTTENKIYTIHLNDWWQTDDLKGKARNLHINSIYRHIPEMRKWTRAWAWSLAYTLTKRKWKKWKGI